MLSLDASPPAYGGFQALFGVSLEVKAGEAVAVIGPPGAGTTTLLRVISQADRPVRRRDPHGKPARSPLVPAHEVIARGIAHVPENRRLFPRLTVEENLKMGSFVPSARKKYRPRTSSWVFQTLPPAEGAPQAACRHALGGEQQMCAIGRALMSGPKLLLLDEPSAGLAPVVVQSIFELVRKICREGYTVLIVEQNIRQVLKVVERAYLLEAGKIKLRGPSQELLQSEEIRKAYLGL
jgi:branched-chain amino acid transport system ATP-binding protein